MIPNRYILEGFTVEHDVRERTATYVESVCGAQAATTRLSKNRPLKVVQCADCALMREAEQVASRRGRGISLPPKETILE